MFDNTINISGTCAIHDMEWTGGKLPDSDFELEGRIFSVWPYASCAVCGHCDGTQTTLTLDQRNDQLICRYCVDKLTWQTSKPED